jgi:phosphatidylserine/phosphatidylglycerophosphate/cardiolipin synthase-like enzyme
MEVYFNDIRTKLADRLDTATKNIKIAMAWFTNQVLFQVLITKAAGGTKIELILSDSEANFNLLKSPKFELLQKKGAKVYVIRSFDSLQFMHHKFAIIDEVQVITGSYNWSNNANTNHENIIIISDPKVAKVYSLQFDELLKKEICVSLDQFKISYKTKSVESIKEADNSLFELAEQFNQEVERGMNEANSLRLGLRKSIIDDLIKRYTAVGAARKLSNDSEQSGFLKLVAENRADLTFEYLTAKSKFAKLFDAVTIKNAKEKLRPYLRDKVNDL